MEKLPKIVAKFVYTKNANLLRQELLDRCSTEIQIEAGKIRAGVGILSKLKLYQLGNGKWGFYPKMIFDGDFDGSEDLTVYISRVVDFIKAALSRRGCTNVVVTVNGTWQP